MTERTSDTYARYLRRFQEKFGDVNVTETVRNEGCLVTKMTADEFERVWTRYRDLETYLRDSMTAGHTLIDAMEAEYRELCASVMEKPKDFKLL